ncbi:MAG TPA: bifunctional riboflavin kinase/FAD synthetase [Blastocatellia bacterium]|nr:bifunctional riboflavin kinase/FAD synthetase [Blastocatellia bacterium]
MRVFRDLEEAELQTPVILTFGVFDGLHLGHQQIMSKVVARARATGLPATVVTFDPHPRAVLHPETAPPMLQTFEQKVEGMQKLGIDQVVALHFDHQMAEVTAEDFLRRIIFGSLDAQEVYLGHGFAFGHNREGRFDLLKQVAGRLGRVAEEIPEIRVRGRRISSTVIRRLLSAGRVNLARRMLGRPYGVEGRVVEGRKIAGSQLNYATANLKPQNYVLPATGVYVTLSLVEGIWLRSITNIGHRPTFGGDAEVVVETHILNFDRELYGERLRVRFLHRLRGEVKFESVGALRSQIDRDYGRAERYFERRFVKRSLEYR